MCVFVLPFWRAAQHALLCCHHDLTSRKQKTHVYGQPSRGHTTAVRQSSHVFLSLMSLRGQRRVKHTVPGKALCKQMTALMRSQW